MIGSAGILLSVALKIVSRAQDSRSRSRQSVALTAVSRVYDSQSRSRQSITFTTVSRAHGSQSRLRQSVDLRKGRSRSRQSIVLNIVSCAQDIRTEERPVALKTVSRAQDNKSRDSHNRTSLE